MSIDDAKKLIDTEKSIRLANLEVEVDIVKADIIFNKYKAFCDGVYQAYQVTNGLFAYPVIKCSGILFYPDIISMFLMRSTRSPPAKPTQPRS